MVVVVIYNTSISVLSRGTLAECCLFSLIDLGYGFEDSESRPTLTRERRNFSSVYIFQKI